jgi:hypothetical protein
VLEERGTFKIHCAFIVVGVFGIKFFGCDEDFLGSGIEPLRSNRSWSDDGECQETPNEELPDSGCDVTNLHGDE